MLSRPTVTRVPRRRQRMLITVLLLVAFTQGCYHYRVTTPTPDPATEYEKRTSHGLLWGLVKDDQPARDCEKSKALDEVRVSTNFGYALATVLSLGIWSPLDVEWRCAKPKPRRGSI